MVILKVLLFILLICAARGKFNFKTTCIKDDYRDMENKSIANVTEYCHDKLCVLKCCGDGELINAIHICKKEHVIRKKFEKYDAQIREQYNYTKVKLYVADDPGVKESKKIATEIVFIFKTNFTECSADMTSNTDFYILEDGSLRAQLKEMPKTWYDIPKLEYCVDYHWSRNDKTLIFSMREPKTDQGDANAKTMYSLIGFLISIFFLLLVLLVYWMLPDLQNLIGLIMMAYVSTLMTVFLLKCIIILTNMQQTHLFCRIISPMLYFSVISSFFWLNIMAFDVYLSLSRSRSSRGCSKRVKYRKFMTYSLYAWGIPVLITAIVTVLNNIDVSKLGIKVVPPFEDCMPPGNGTTYYLDVPIGILISTNIILFIMTVYHIWEVRRAVSNVQNSTKSSHQNNKLYVCLKLSLIMGVSWILELFETEGIAMFVILNTYNLLTGVAIFFLFVFKKSIFVKLCQKFNIDNDWVRNYESSTHTKSMTTKSTRFSKSKQSSQIKEIEMASTTNYSNKEETLAA